MILENDASFKSAAREQESLLTPLEKKALLWLAHRMPVWVSPDHLTVLGLLGMTLAGVCYYLARWSPFALLGSILFLFINWFGDSLDGTLARVRQRQRPRYGFYVDHIVDTIGALFLIGGLGLSGFMTGVVALALLIAYFMLSIEIYLATYTIGVFKLSYGIWGPTELRIMLSIGTLALLAKPIVRIWGSPYFLCDIGAVVAIAAMGVILLTSVVRNTLRLYDEERLP
jgi:phosphatidylglycerophosphate synthase